MQFLSHLGGESLYRSLENIQASIEMSRKKQLNKAAAMVEYKVGPGGDWGEGGFFGGGGGGDAGVPGWHRGWSQE